LAGGVCLPCGCAPGYASTTSPSSGCALTNGTCAVCALGSYCTGLAAQPVGVPCGVLLPCGGLGTPQAAGALRAQLPPPRVRPPWLPCGCALRSAGTYCPGGSAQAGARHLRGRLILSHHRRAVTCGLWLPRVHAWLLSCRRRRTTFPLHLRAGHRISVHDGKLGRPTCACATCAVGVELRGRCRGAGGSMRMCSWYVCSRRRLGARCSKRVLQGFTAAGNSLGSPRRACAPQAPTRAAAQPQPWQPALAAPAHPVSPRPAGAAQPAPCTCAPGTASGGGQRGLTRRLFVHAARSGLVLPRDNAAQAQTCTCAPGTYSNSTGAGSCLCGHLALQARIASGAEPRPSGCARAAGSYSSAVSVASPATCSCGPCAAGKHRTGGAGPASRVHLRRRHIVQHRSFLQHPPCACAPAVPVGSRAPAAPHRLSPCSRLFRSRWCHQLHGPYRGLRFSATAGSTACTACRACATNLTACQPAADAVCAFTAKALRQPRAQLSCGRRAGCSCYRLPWPQQPPLLPVVGVCAVAGQVLRDGGTARRRAVDRVL
jgi:hypothetical protein